MLLRRFVTHIRSENWFAVALDLTVVVVGIFIGFQVDRLYEAQRSQSNELVNLAALAEDFAANRTRLERSIQGHSDKIEAALTLRAQARNPQPDLSVDALNELVVKATSLPTFDVVRRAYDNLTNTGELARISSAELRTAVAEFYSTVELVELVQNTQELQFVTIVQPYMMNNLDYAATTRMRRFTPEQAMRLEPFNHPEAITSVLRTREFENLVVIEWETGTDLKQLHERLLNQLEHIEDLIADQNR
jgi:hypothetical protein